MLYIRKRTKLILIVHLDQVAKSMGRLREENKTNRDDDICLVNYFVVCSSLFILLFFI